jgi:hypothetical protein
MIPVLSNRITGNRMAVSMKLLPFRLFQNPIKLFRCAIGASIQRLRTGAASIYSPDRPI